MSKLLSTPGDGILKTHISWEEIEQDVQNALKTKATFGPNKTVRNLSLGRGFTSRMALIEPDWQNGEDRLPKALIAKIPSVMNFLEFNELMAQKGRDWNIDDHMLEMWQGICTRVHNSECLVYEIIQKYANGKIKIPLIMATKKFDEHNTHKGNLMMEYVESCELQVYDNITFEDMKEPLRMIAVFQVIGTKLDEETKEKLPLNLYSNLFGEMFNDEKRKEFLDQFRKFDSGSIPKETLDKFSYVFEKEMAEEGIKRIDTLSDILGVSRVLCHGDMWSTNLLWKKENNGRHELAAIIDWQTSHFGCPAVDVCRFLMASLSGKDRRQYKDEVLKTLYKYLEEEMDGAEPPYTFAQVLERIREKTLTMVEDVIEYYQKCHPDEKF
ncbi:hypothetical protein WR25_13996 [Diploscapter pachys]|uniref:CHK kinase-like domain-containing protein n=1 Tax=Diploscapter pachys TaxID=2018661 RepID=A0A2A2KVD5_9BILA|nr:hypothetical protein WR25_13996 [Diploscapter pachys]